MAKTRFWPPLGVAFIRGMQGPNPDLPDVIATPKHFAVHSGPESTRHAVDVVVSAHDLEDSYLPAFRAAIVDARAGSVMCAYNRVNGEPACASESCSSSACASAWGFQGYVVSDCDAVSDISDTTIGRRPGRGSRAGAEGRRGQRVQYQDPG